MGMTTFIKLMPSKRELHYFLKENMADMLNNIIIEHDWREPLGTGEISIIDNLSCLHASYYPQPSEKGYKIGVRYVG